MILGRYFFVITLLSAVCSVSAISAKPTVDQATATIGLLRKWINLDLEIETAPSKNILDEEASVCIILRHHGEVLGVGTASCKNDNPIVVAADMAFSELQESNFLSKLQPEIRQHVYNSISIELELGGTPIPSPSKHLERFASTISEGECGVAVRRGNRWTIRLPAEMRLSPSKKDGLVQTLESLCITVGVHPAVALSRQLPTQNDITLYTIPTITMVQDSNGLSPRLLQSGDELVSVASIRQRGVHHIADLLASHLLTCTNESGVTIGGYQPETDVLTLNIAPSVVQVMVASALQEYANIDKVLYGKEANSVVALILEQLATSYANDAPIQNDVAALITIMLGKDRKAQSDLIDEFYAKCRKQMIDIALNITSEQAIISDKPYVLSMISKAISVIAIQEESNELRSLAESMCLACLSQTSLDTRVSLIPWLIDAMLDLNETGSELNTKPILELLDVALVTQIKSNERKDLVGGFGLVTLQGVVVDARGIRMIPMLTRFCVSNEVATSRSTVLHALILASRFVAQLTTREQRSHRFLNPTITKGGVRSATWDASMPTEATAMALIGISRTIEAFRIASQLY